MFWWCKFKYIDETIKRGSRVVKFSTIDGTMSVWKTCLPSISLSKDSVYTIEQIREMEYDQETPE